MSLPAAFVRKSRGKPKDSRVSECFKAEGNFAKYSKPQAKYGIRLTH